MLCKQDAASAHAGQLVPEHCSGKNCTTSAKAFLQDVSSLVDKPVFGQSHLVLTFLLCPTGLLRREASCSHKDSMLSLQASERVDTSSKGPVSCNLVRGASCRRCAAQERLVVTCLATQGWTCYSVSAARLVCLLQKNMHSRCFVRSSDENR